MVAIGSEQRIDSAENLSKKRNWIATEKKEKSRQLGFRIWVYVGIDSAKSETICVVIWTK